jgi:transcription antitermination factor NusA-like protein
MRRVKKTAILSRNHRKVLPKLLKVEVQRSNTELYKCARDVEKDRALLSETDDWNITISDGIDNET